MKKKEKEQRESVALRLRADENGHLRLMIRCPRPLLALLPRVQVTTSDERMAWNLCLAYLATSSASLPSWRSSDEPRIDDRGRAVIEIDRPVSHEERVSLVRGFRSMLSRAAVMGGWQC